MTEFYRYFKEAFYGDNKYSVITARRREGKTTHAVIWLASVLLQNPNQKALWIDTVQANLSKYYDRYWYQLLSAHIKSGEITYNRQSHIMTFKNGSTIDFVSAERPENIEGFGYDYLVANEAGIIFKKASLWENTLAPMSKDAKKVILVGTPKGMNKFYELAQKELTSKEWKTFRINPETSKQWTVEELLEAKLQVPDMVFRQEYCGEFVSNGAGVFRYGDTQRELSRNQTIVLGIDLGRHNDATVIKGLDSSLRTTFLESWTDLSFEIQKPRIIEIWAKLGYPKVNLDMTGLGQSVFDSLQVSMGNKIEGISFTSTTKKDMIQNMQILIEQNRYLPFHDQQELDQISAYEYQSTKGGGVTYNAPDGQHDDFVIATALALLEFKPTSKVRSQYWVG